jgi:hypothetical protein
LIRPIRKEDWKRFSVYAARVKLLFSGADEWSLSNILPTMALSLPPNTFPALKGITWRHPGVQFSHIGTFLSPAITTVSFRSTQESLSLLPILPSKCPDLRNISITPDPDPDTWDSLEELHAISSFLCELSDAESIRVPQLNQAAMGHLSGMPSLTSLLFHRFSEASDWSTAVHEQGFTSLHKLQLLRPNVEDSIALLQSFHHVPLKSLSVAFSDSAGPSQLDAFFSALSAGVLHPCLSDLWMQSQDHSSQLPDGYHIENRTFRLLFSFCNFTSVAIHISGGFDLDDTIVLDLSRAWPLIEFLGLFEGVTHTRVTLACLSSFAVNCPRLTQLEMLFNTTTIPRPPNAASTSVRTHRLETLVVCHSPLLLSHVDRTARFLAAHFPALKEIHAYEGVWRKSWDAVLRRHGRLLVVPFSADPAPGDLEVEYGGQVVP